MKPKALRNLARKRGRPTEPISSMLSLVHSFLPKDGSKIPANDLRHKAAERRMSYTTLYKNLVLIEKMGLVSREFDMAKYPPLVYYRNTSPFWLGGLHPMGLRKLNSLKLNVESLIMGLKMAEGKKIPRSLLKMIREEIKNGITGLLASVSLLLGEILKEAGTKAPEHRETSIRVTTQLYVNPIIQSLTKLSLISPGSTDLTGSSLERIVRREFSAKSTSKKRGILDRLAKFADLERYKVRKVALPMLKKQVGRKTKEKGRK